MGSEIKLTGQWKGLFWYGEDYGDLYGESVEFMMFLEEENGEVNGKCFEMGGKGVSSNADLALIKGFINGHEISFIKRYDHAVFFDENGNVQDNFFEPSQEIIYHGEFDESEYKYSGSWEIVIKEDLVEGGILEHLNTGTWEMKKEID